ncbi:MAG TPA: AI-2E family transporter [Sphingomicrobium sp.]
MSTRTVNTAQIITGTAAGLALLYFLRTILIPLVIAFVLAVLVNALVRWIQRLWPRAPFWTVSILTGLIVIFLAAGGIFVMAQGAVQMVAQGPALVSKLEQIVQSTGRSMGLREPVHLTTIIGSVSIPEIAGSLLSGLQGLASGVLLIIVYFGFILAGQQRIGRKIDAVAGASESSRAVKDVVARIAADIRTYVWVQTVTGAILTASAALIMLIVGLHNVLFWSVIFFLLTFIPNIGVTVGSIAPSLFALIQFPTPWQALVIFGAIQIVATVVGNLIYPRLQAETQNIDPVATILSLAFWTFLWGLPGAFLAVPLTLMLMMVFAQFESTTWIAAMLSNDGKPRFRKKR